MLFRLITASARSLNPKARSILLGVILLPCGAYAENFAAVPTSAAGKEIRQPIVGSTPTTTSPRSLPLTNASYSLPFPQSIRVMTYNIHHGEGLDGKVDLQRIADLIKQEAADIVTLQEVDKGVARTQRRDLPAELAALTGMTAVFSNNFHFQGGEYGNAVLTKYPIKSWTNHHYQMLRPNEQRGILQLILDVHGHEIVVMNTHIDYRPDDTERWLNVSEIETLARRHEGKSIVLCGDFNDPPDSRIHQQLQKNFGDAWQQVGQGDGFTFPARAPNKRIDFIWLSRNSAIEPLKIWVPHSEASDHLPVVVELKLK